MNAKHTKGPWVYDETYALIVAVEDGHSTEVGACHSTPANGRLMAAAPDLLEAAEFALSELRDQYNFANEHGGPMERARIKACRLLTDAIDKARGEK